MLARLNVMYQVQVCALVYNAQLHVRKFVYHHRIGSGYTDQVGATRPDPTQKVRSKISGQAALKNLCSILGRNDLLMTVIGQTDVLI